MCAQRRLRSARASIQSDQSLHCPHAESLGTELPIEQDSDQTGWMSGLIWVFAGCKGHFVGFVMLRLTSSLAKKQIWQVFVANLGILRIFYGCAVRIENSVLRVIVWHYEASLSDAKQCDPEGWIYPHRTSIRFFFLHTIPFGNFPAKAILNTTLPCVCSVWL